MQLQHLTIGYNFLEYTVCGTKLIDSMTPMLQ